MINIFTKVKLTLAVMLFFTLANAQPGYYGPTFTHIADTANCTDNNTAIFHPTIDNNNTAKLIVTQNSGFNGITADLKFGVYYDAISLPNRWTIFNEATGSSTIPLGSGWNVLIPASNGVAYTHQTFTNNITGNKSVVFQPQLDGNPNAIFFITHNYTTGSLGAINNKNVGVFYNGTNWELRNEDLSAFPANTAYDIFIPTAGANVFKHTANNANINGNQTVIDNALTNNKPNAVLFITHNIGTSSVLYNDAPIGVKYTGTNWAIFNQNVTAMPDGATFNVLVVDSVNYNEPTSITEQAANANFMTVFPNPATESATIGYVLKNTGNVTLSVVNMLGQKVIDVYTGNQAKGNYTQTSNTSSLAPGMYYYLLTVDGVQSRKAFVKN